MRKQLLILLAFPLIVFGFGTGTVKKIDQIESNTGTDITITPNTGKVVIPYLSTGDIPYDDSGLTGLAIGTIGQLLAVSAGGVPEWIDAPSSSPTTTEGDLIVRGATEDERLAIGTLSQVLTSDGTTASWEDAPAGSGGINYLEGDSSDIEATIGDWVAYDDGTTDIPVDGTGGTPTEISLSRNTTAPLRGTGDLKAAWIAGLGQQGQGQSVDFTIDKADQARKLIISFDYDFTGSTSYADGDLAVFIYDVTNTNLIRVNGEGIVAGQGKHYAQFQTAPDSVSYRLIVHAVTSSMGTSDIFFDNISAAPQVITHGTIVTDWEDFTPTGSFTNTTYSGKYRRVGDSAEVQIKLVLTGAPGAILLDVDLPPGLTIDTNKLAIATQATQILGHASIRDFGTRSYPGFVAYKSTNDLYVYTYEDTGVDEQFSILSESNPVTFATSDEIIVNYSVPIVGWSSNAKMSEDFSGRDVVGLASLSSNQSVTTASATKVLFDSASEDTVSFFDSSNNRFNIVETGYYDIGSSLLVTAFTVDENAQIQLRVNGSIVTRSGQHAGSSSRNVSIFLNGYKLNKDDYVEIFIDSSADTAYTINSDTGTFFSVAKRASPQTQLENELVAFKARTGSGAVVADGVAIVYGTVDYDSHNFYNETTGLATVQISGKYLACGKVGTQAVAADAVGSIVGINLNVNGSRVDVLIRKSAKTTSSISHYVNGCSQLELNKGDTVELIFAENFTNTINMTPTDDFNTFEMIRIK